MELQNRRESSVQRRAAAAVGAERATGCADDMMQKMLDDAATGSKDGSAGAPAVKDRPTKTVNSEGLLDAFGPVGPPLSFSPGMPPMSVEDETEGKKNRGETR